MRIRFTRPALLCLIVLLLAACAGQTSANIVESDARRDTSPPADPATLNALAADNAAFAFDLYGALKGREGNLFFSPHSISTALAMVYAGAKDETAAEMAGSLRYELPPEELHPAFNALDLALAEAPEDGEGEFQLSTANSLWGQEEFPFRQDFADLLAQHYGSQMRLVDYIDEGRREAARQAINGWVEDETQGKIEELFAPGILTEDTRLVLANAIYFKGEWVEPFNPESPEADFHNLDGTTSRVPLMSRRANAPYAEGVDFQAVELPYKGGRISMVVILPAEGRFAEFEAGLDAGRLEAVLSSLQVQDLKLYLPRFQFDAELLLNETLQALGMGTAFHPQKADFTGMYDREAVGANLFLSTVIHKAFIAVDEIGTEAAAATGAVMEIESMPAMMRVDRPFLFLIRDGETGAILFLGRVVKLP